MQVVAVARESGVLSDQGLQRLESQLRWEIVVFVVVVVDSYLLLLLFVLLMLLLLW